MFNIDVNWNEMLNSYEGKIFVVDFPDKGNL